MVDPWAFGWTHLISGLQLLVAVVIAVIGFRTFQKWRAEQIEQKRIDVAIEALSLAYEANFIFDYIRSVAGREHEWKDMPVIDGESDEDRNRRATYFVSRHRIANTMDYFERINKVQPQCMALFGVEIQKTFNKIYHARQNILIAADILPGLDRSTHNDASNELMNQLRADIWAGFGEHAKQGDRTGGLVSEFVAEIERLMKPVVDIGKGTS